MRKLSKEEVVETMSGTYKTFDPFDGAWFVYMLRCSDGSLYTGVTNNLPFRIITHNSGRGSKYVRSRLPARLVWSRMAGDKSSALKEEHRIKKLPKRRKEAMLKWDRGTPWNEMLRLHLDACPPPPEGIGRLSAMSISLGLSDPDSLEIRDRLVKKYAWGTPTGKALREILSHGPVVEMGAGGGYWTMLLRKLRGDVVAYDLHADGTLNMWNPGGETWTDVLQGEPDVLRGHGDRALFLCWPTLGEMASECLGTWGGDTLIYVGDHRFTADDDFHAALSDGFVRTKVVDLPGWPMVEDVLEVWKRIRA